MILGITDSKIEEWYQFPQRLVGEYIKDELEKQLEKTLKFIPAYRQKPENLFKQKTKVKFTNKTGGIEPVSLDLTKMKVVKQELQKLIDAIRGKKMSDHAKNVLTKPLQG